MAIVKILEKNEFGKFIIVVINYVVNNNIDEFNKIFSDNISNCFFSLL